MLKRDAESLRERTITSLEERCFSEEDKKIVQELLYEAALVACEGRTGFIYYLETPDYDDYYIEKYLKLKGFNYRMEDDKILLSWHFKN